MSAITVQEMLNRLKTYPTNSLVLTPSVVGDLFPVIKEIEEDSDSDDSNIPATVYLTMSYWNYEENYSPATVADLITSLSTVNKNAVVYVSTDQEVNGDRPVFGTCITSAVHPGVHHYYDIILE